MVAVIIGITVGIAVLALLYKPLFRDREEFFRCIKFGSSGISVGPE